MTCGCHLLGASSSKLPELVCVSIQREGVEMRAGRVTGPSNVDDEGVPFLIRHFALDDVPTRLLFYELSKLVIIVARLFLERLVGVVAACLNIDYKGNTAVICHLALDVGVSRHNHPSLALSVEWTLYGLGGAYGGTAHRASDRDREARELAWFSTASS